MIVLMTSSEHKRLMRKVLVPMTLRHYLIPLGVLLALLTPWLVAALVIWLLAS